MPNYSYISDIFYVEVDDVDKHMGYLTHVSWAKAYWPAKNHILFLKIVIMEGATVKTIVKTIPKPKKKKKKLIQNSQIY